jgi:hypothetical protein
VGGLQADLPIGGVDESHAELSLPGFRISFSFQVAAAASFRVAMRSNIFDRNYVVVGKDELAT